MSQPLTPEEIARKLLAIAEPRRRSRLLDLHASDLGIGVVECLKREVDQAIRADARRATEIAQTARAVADRLQDPRADALSLRALAEALQFAGRYRHALHAYRHAREIHDRLGEEVEVARIERNEAMVFIELGRFDEALAAARRARSTFIRLGEHHLSAQADTHIGNVHYLLNQPRAALTWYDRAQVVFAAEGDEFSRALIDYNRAAVFCVLNEFGKAEKLFVHSCRIYERRGFPLMAADVHYSLAYISRLRSRYFEALAYLDKALQLYRAGNDPKGCALCDLDTARLRLALNLPDQAETTAQQARTAFASMGTARDVAEADSLLAAAAGSQGRFERALEIFERATSRFQEQGNTFQVGVISLARAAVHQLLGDVARAGSLARQAQALFQAMALPDWSAQAEMQLAEIELSRGDGEAAWTLARSALGRLGDRDRPELLYRGHHLLGRVLAQRGQIEHASRHLDQALDEIEKVWRDVRLEPLRVAFLRDKESVYVDAVRVKLRLPGTDGIAAAFTCAERCRARGIVEMLAHHSMPRVRRKEGVAPELYRRFVRLREELEWLHNRTVSPETEEVACRLPLDPDRFRDDTDRREHELTDVRRQLREVDQEFSDLLGFYAVSAEAVRSTLTPTEALLEYFVAGDEVLVFVLRSADLTVRTCPATRRSLRRSLRGLRFQIEKHLHPTSYLKTHETQLQRSVEHHLGDLHEQLIAPVADLIGGRDLVIVPHDLLNYVPFHALRGRRRHVIDSHAVVYAPSAHVYLLATARQVSARRGFTILGAEDPAVPGIAQEAHLLARLLPEARLNFGRDATRAALASGGRGRQVVHLAAHATFRSDNPMLSAVQLSDGPLRVSDIYDLDLDADLVTLSGCETGVSEAATGNEILGLIRGFLHAGARTLLVSLWPVNDRSTLIFMESFYRQLLAGQRPRQALRTAQIATRSLYPHPFHWAPFVLAGGA